MSSTRLLQLLVSTFPRHELLELITTIPDPTIASTWGIYKVDGELYRAFILAPTGLRLHPEYATNLVLATKQLQDLYKPRS